jgi:hypothetical protein|eukprot:COSAG06_NODE_42_length_29897_cov_42.547721_2_plen_77_part_00
MNCLESRGGHRDDDPDPEEEAPTARLLRVVLWQWQRLLLLVLRLLLVLCVAAVQCGQHLLRGLPRRHREWPPASSS